ncbi:hypothetical protein [Flectobacillus roseus]|uniref:hypothetical protein n=1 Tax=Flectobacillus roseus TaxID=502259 RepID=UPI0024B7101B|nr:hypothetical protein [Flectobacillus roseus]MDI9869243.1 hypothetical protein [Flectobacillus roseus]
MTIAEFETLGSAEDIQSRLSLAGIKAEVSKDAQFELQVLEKDVNSASKLIEYFMSQN